LLRESVMSVVRVFLVIGWLMALAGVTGVQGVVADSAGSERRISMNRLPISLVPPADWLQDNWGTDRLAFSGPVFNGYAPNFTLAATPYAGYPPVGQIIDEIRAGLGPEVEVLHQGLREVDRRPGGVLRIALDLEGTRMVNEQILVVGDGMLYTLSFMAPAEVYPTLEPLFEAVIRSIHVD